VNPDGKTISYQINGETYDDEIPSLLETLGHKVSGIAPIQADESFVQPTWRAGLAALPSDDNVRKAYVESNLKKMGMKGEVVGSGDDWYFHNPDTGKWYATTNAKGFDMTDLIGGAVATPQMLASIVGGGIGAAGGAGLAGPAGAVAGGMAGSAAGDLAGGQLTRALARSFDPELNQVLSEKGGQFGTEDLVSAGISGPSRSCEGHEQRSFDTSSQRRGRRIRSRGNPHVEGWQVRSRKPACDRTHDRAYTRAWHCAGCGPSRARR
jgi:hypothetical protein